METGTYPWRTAMEPTRDELLARIKELEAERNFYRHQLSLLLRDESITFTQEEIDDLDKNGVPFEDIVREVEEMFQQAQTSGQQGNAA
jgi:uncharacterized coiled-coil DUF342 family protein